MRRSREANWSFCTIILVKASLLVLTVTIGVLHCRLCFADATQAANGLWLGDGNGLLSMEKGAVELHENIFASREEEVTALGDIPECSETFLGG
jgi:hypothetical protein